MKLIEDHAADLLLTYLTSAAALAADVPDETTLPKIAGSLREDEATPMLAIVVKRQPTDHPRVVTLDIEHQLVCDDTAAAIATASAQAQIIRAFLAAATALDAFLADLSEEDADGWELNVNHVPSEVRQSPLDTQRHLITIRQCWTVLIDDRLR